MASEWNEQLFEQVCATFEIAPEMRETLRKLVELDRAYTQARKAEEAQFWEDLQLRLQQAEQNFKRRLQERVEKSDG